jgi:hypothetical protein
MNNNIDHKEPEYMRDWTFFAPVDERKPRGVKQFLLKLLV